MTVDAYPQSSHPIVAVSCTNQHQSSAVGAKSHLEIDVSWTNDVLIAVGASPSDLLLNRRIEWLHEHPQPSHDFGFFRLLHLDPVATGSMNEE